MEIIQIICLLLIIMLPVFKFGFNVANYKKDEDIKGTKAAGLLIAFIIRYTVIYLAGLFNLLFSLA